MKPYKETDKVTERGRETERRREERDRLEDIGRFTSKDSHLLNPIFLHNDNNMFDRINRPSRPSHAQPQQEKEHAPVRFCGSTPTAS